MEPFAIKDCALIAVATGERAQTLRELRDRLESTHPGCIYYHFWGGLLEPRFDDPEYQNDFASWAWHGLHEARLAERLGIIDPTEYPDLEDLRHELVEVIEEVLDESEILGWMRASQRFHFIRSQIVVLDTAVQITHPGDLSEFIGRMSLGSIFYHFIDARRRTEHGNNDFSEWLMGLGEEYAPLAKRIAALDPYFTSLSEMRRDLEGIIRAFNQKGIP